MTTLHIWGGLDDLPSIDAECIATLALLIHSGELDETSVITSFDPSTSTNGDFPLLTSKGQTFAGYNCIADHLSASSNSSQSSSPQADIQAWASFIQQRGQALLDLYLYVSSTNYWSAISPAFTKILPWHANYLIPPARRAAALARTKHLGIRALDLDNIDEYAPGEESQKAGPSASPAQTTNPEDLIKKQKSAKWLQTQQHADTFQLFQLMKAFFVPLEELLGEKKYLLSDDAATAVDYVALGYLSLMRYADVPQPWLGDAFRTRYPKLNAYTERLYHETFLDPAKPWRSSVAGSPSPTPIQAASSMGRGILDWAIPSLKQTTTIDSSIDRSKSQKSASPASAPLLSTILSPAILLPIGALAAIAFGITRYISVSPSENKENKHHRTFRARENDFMTPTTLAELGESGAMLSALGGVFDQEQQFEREKTRTGGAPVVEVDVDVQDAEGDVVRDVVYKK